MNIVKRVLGRLSYHRKELGSGVEDCPKCKKKVMKYFIDSHRGIWSRWVTVYLYCDGECGFAYGLVGYIRGRKNE